MVQDVAKLTRSVVQVVRKERRPMVGAWSLHWRKDVSLGRSAGCFQRRRGGGAGVALPYASEVFDDCSYSGRRISSSDRAFIRERFCFEFLGDWRYWSL